MPILGIIASSKFGDAGDFESIATVSVGSGGAANVEFTSIPGTYTHLQIRAIARKTAIGSIENLDRMTLNSDTGSNYSDHFIYGTGSSVSTNAGVNVAFMIVTDSANDSANANVFGVTVLDILDYANTNKYKTLRSLCGLDNNGSGAVIFTSGSWRNTAAITSIKIATNEGSFKQYSHFALYGIRSA